MRVAVASFLVASGALGAGVRATEPPAPAPVEAEPETGVVDDAVVAVGLPPLPPTIDTEEAPETGEVDGAVVAVGLPPVPSTTVPATTVPPTTTVPATPDPGPDTAAVESIVADVAASLRSAERFVGRLGF